MIQLNKLNGDTFTLNAILIEQVEALSDTTITLINGKKVLAKNSCEEVIRFTAMFYKQVGLQQVYKQVGENNE